MKKTKDTMTDGTFRYDYEILWHDLTLEEQTTLNELTRKIVKRMPFAIDLADFKSNFKINCTGDWHD
jgi:hypothetical protein